MVSVYHRRRGDKIICATYATLLIIMEILGYEVSVTLILIAAVPLVLAWYDWWCHQYFQRLGIPVADYSPFFGNLLQWRQGIHKVFTDYVKKHGRVVGIYSFRLPALLICDADILKNVMVKNFSHFTNRKVQPLTQKPMSRGLLALQNEEWREVRNVVTPSFSASKMRQMSALLNECCDTLVSSFATAQEGGAPAECRQVYGAFTMDSIAKCGFGLNVDSQKNKDDPFVKHAKKIFEFTLSNPALLIGSAFPTLAALFAPILHRLNVTISDPETIKFFKEVTEAACSMRKEEGDGASKRIDLLQLMLNAHNDTEDSYDDTSAVNNGKRNGTMIPRKPLSTEEVMAQAVTFFVAGYETTNTLLTFTSYLLAMNQDVQEKLHSEIEERAPSRDSVGYDVIAKMEYLDMVVSEALRMYPPASLFDRMCNETVSYGDLTIEKGVRVFVSLWTIHHDEEYWPNPDKFDPERFSAENKASIKPCTYMPFGYGPRNCIGMRFALLEAKMALVRVLQQYRFDVCSETEIPPTLGKMGFLAPKTLMLRAVPRK